MAWPHIQSQMQHFCMGTSKKKDISQSYQFQVPWVVRAEAGVTWRQLTAVWGHGE